MMSAAKFTAVRGLLGITLDALAQELGVNPRTVRSWSEGRDAVPAWVPERLHEMRQLHDADLGSITATKGPVLLPRNREDDQGRPRGWWAGIAARVVALDPERDIEWGPELTRTARLLEEILHTAGITTVLRVPKPTLATVQTPSYRVKCRSLLTRGGRIAQAPVERQERMLQEVQMWQGGDLDATDVGQLRMIASHTPNMSWTRWIQQHADQIPDGWEPVEVVPNPHNQALVWAY